MLHLLPIRIFLAVAIGLGFIAALLASSAGQVGTLASTVTFLGRWAWLLSAIVIVALFAAWRWVPRLQSAIFPYIGGTWTGAVHFRTASGEDQRSVTLMVRHTLLGAKLLLDSEESTSRTLSFYAEKNSDFEKYRIYYVYLNERKEGVQGAGQRYRGVAVLRVESGSLVGDYFTDANRKGRISLTLAKGTPWWAICR